MYARNNQAHLAKHFCSRGHAAREMLEFYESESNSYQMWLVGRVYDRFCASPE